MANFKDMAEKAMGNSAMGKAVKGGAKMFGAMQGCSNEMGNPMGGDDLTYEKGESLCLVMPSGEQLEVTLLDNVKEGQSNVLAQMPNGRKQIVNADWLVDKMNCSDIEYQEDEDEQESD